MTSAIDYTAATRTVQTAFTTTLDKWKDGLNSVTDQFRALPVGTLPQVDAAFERAGVTRTVAFELGSSDSVVRFAGLGFGAALVPASAAATVPGVSVLPLPDPLARHPISLVHRAPEPSAPSARAFLALLRERVAQPPM